MSIEPGPVNASCDHLRIIVEAHGGHGACPHRTRDPILALSLFVVALQALVGRRPDPTHPGVLSIGWTRTGSVENVFPEVAEAGGHAACAETGRPRAPARGRPRDRRGHRPRARVRREGRGYRGRARDYQRRRHRRGGTRPRTRGRLRARSAPDLLRVRRFRLLRPPGADPDGVRGPRRRPGYRATVPAPPALSAPTRGGEDRRPRAGRGFRGRVYPGVGPCSG